MRVQGIDDVLPPRIELTLVLLLGQADQHLVKARIVEVLYARVLDSGRVDGMPDGADIRAIRELHLNLGAAAEVHAQRNRVAGACPVRAHRGDAGHAEE